MKSTRTEFFSKLDYYILAHASCGSGEYNDYLITLHRNKMAGSDEGFPSALRDCVIDNITIGKQIGRGAKAGSLRLNGKEL